MGQNSSRTQPRLTHHDSTLHDDCGLPSTSDNTATTSVPPSRENPSNCAPNNTEPETSLPTGYPRRSFRRSLLSLVKPQSRTSSHEGSLASGSSNKRSWMNPRRWSRVPPISAEVADGPLSTPRHDAPSDMPTVPIDVKGKGREENEDIGVQDVEPSPSLNYPLQDATNSGFEQSEFAGAGPPPPNDLEAFQTMPPQENALQLVHIPNSDEALLPDKQDSPPSSALDEAQNHLDDPTSTSMDTENPASQEQTPTIHESPENRSATATVPTPSRPFPPPGTLVVVQGVVHTTDVPRTSAQTPNTGINNDNVFAEQGRTQSRWPVFRERNASSNHRMAMPPRPHSAGATFNAGELHPEGDGMSSSDQQAERGGFGISDESDNNAYTDQGSGEAANMAPNTAEPTTNPTQSTTPEGTERSSVQDNGSSVEGEPRSVDQPESEDRNPPGSISSSSIDVLGTLLSVAAAATAASLLTGSSEPILPTSSTSFANSQGNPSFTSPSPNPTTPHDLSAASRAERMRSAWSSIRERLGIRSSGSSDNAPSSNGSGSATQAATDTREMMLSEMARAFSVGLGLGGFSGPSSSNNGSNTSSSTEAPVALEPRPPPAEGSFERFLVELQGDLRVALTTGEGGSGVRAMVAGVGWSDRNSSAGEQVQGVAVTRPIGPANDEGDEDARTEISDEQDNLSAGQEPGDSEDESDVATFQEPALEASQRRSSSIREERLPAEPGRINWWRLYRFPAIGVPRTNNAASAAAAAALSTGAAPSPSGPSSQPEHTAEHPPVTASSASDDTSTRTAEAGSARGVGNGNDALQDNTVVPVIIVGLQSVHMEWRPGGESPEADMNSVHGSDGTSDMQDGLNDATSPVPEQDSAADQQPMATVTDTQDVEANQRRGARWRSRAADAFRNLRPRRGGEVRNGATIGDATAPHLVHQMPPIGPGSRMFLIYVIGGYYPPNHSIVLGNPADLESFEALSELAELLGQVKPPTATREDIEKSGLQVIKATQVRQYEREGKVTSNCADRCLICLDDYLPEEDVRVMTCRHAFHKGCVDKWLQTGKNNCPACRSRGVSTETRNPLFS